MSYLRKHPLFTIFLIGILIRFSLLFLDFSFDVHNHISWAKDLWTVGFTHFYSTPSTEVYASLYPNYPPFAMYIFYALYPLHKLIYDVLWWMNLAIPIFPSKLIFIIQERYFVAATMKLPSIMADMGIAWVSYLFAKKLLVPKLRKNNILLLIPALVLFNPAYYYNSAYWGQIDAIPIFFVLAATYCMLYSPRYLLSGLLFTSALLIKPTPIVYLPIFAIAFVKKFGAVNSFKTFVLSNLFFIVSFIPLLSTSLDAVMPYKIYFHNIMQAQSLAFVTNSAFNLWAFSLFEQIKDTDLFVFGISYKLWGYFLLSLMLYVIVRLYVRNKDFFYTSFLSAFAFFLFATKMHERYTLLILPFLLLAAIKDKKLIKWYVILSLLSFLNLYFSWPVPRSEILFSLLHNSIFYLTLSTCHLAIFFYLLFHKGEV